MFCAWGFLCYEEPYWTQDIVCSLYSFQPIWSWIIHHYRWDTLCSLPWALSLHWSFRTWCLNRFLWRELHHFGYFPWDLLFMMKDPVWTTSTICTAGSFSLSSAAITLQWTTPSSKSGLVSPAPRQALGIFRITCRAGSKARWYPVCQPIRLNRKYYLK